MNGLQIEEALAGRLGDEVYFLGCHAESDVGDFFLHARQQNKPCVIIMFIEGDTKLAVGHWVTVYINYSDGVIGYYDTFNLHPALSSPSFHKKLQVYPSLKLRTLCYRIQSINTLFCGLYCMYFCYLLSYNNNDNFFLRTVHRTFKKNHYYYNDKRMIRIAYEKFHMPPCSKVFCDVTAGVGCLSPYCEK